MICFTCMRKDCSNLFIYCKELAREMLKHLLIRFRILSLEAHNAPWHLTGPKSWGDVISVLMRYSFLFTFWNIIVNCHSKFVGYFWAGINKKWSCSCSFWWAEQKDTDARKCCNCHGWVCSDLTSNVILTLQRKIDSENVIGLIVRYTWIIISSWWFI